MSNVPLSLSVSRSHLLASTWNVSLADRFLFRVFHIGALANMQVITAIYLNCRPDLRDEWLSGNEVDDLAEAQVTVGLRNTFLTILMIPPGTRTCA